MKKMILGILLMFSTLSFADNIHYVRVAWDFTLVKESKINEIIKQEENNNAVLKDIRIADDNYIILIFEKINKK